MNDRLFELVDAYLDNRLTDLQADELRDWLSSSSEARQAFWEYVEQHVLIGDILAEGRGHDLALLEEGTGLRGGAGLQPASDGSRLQTCPSSTHSHPGCHLWTRALGVLAVVLLIGVALWLWNPQWVEEFGGSALGIHNPQTVEPVAVATVHSQVGDATVTDPSGKTLPINAGLTLYAGQVLNVGDEESRVEVHFTDGTQVDLGSGTSIRFLAEASEGKKFHLERGAIQVQTVAERENQLMVVTTNQARITAGNSRFRLYQEGTASRVELAQGTAHLESQKGGQSLDLDEGLFVVVTDEPQPMETQSFPMGNCRLLHTFLKAGDAVCFSPDGKRVVASHFDRGWKVWDSEDGTLLVSARGNGERTDALSFTAINDTVIALSRSGTADLWTIGEPRAIRTRLRDQGLRSNVVSEDGRWLAQGGSKGEVVVWEVNPQSGGISLRRSFAIKPSRLALSGEGSHLAVSLWAGEIFVFEVKTGREVARYKLRPVPTPLALSTDARFVAAYANKEGLILFDRQGDSRQTLWAGEGARVSYLQFSRDCRILFAGLGDGTVRAWSTATGELLLVLETGHRHVSRIATTADLSLLATVGDNDCVKIWECELP